MSVAEDSTLELWQSFMPRRHEIKNVIGQKFYSVQNFEGLQNFENFSMETVFEKWAAVEVESVADIPPHMELFTLHGGDYAVFDHRGPASEFHKTLHYIFTEWLPHSGRELDAREHFEILLPGYRPDDPAAEEEVWVPLKQQ